MARQRFSDLERIYDALNTANANWSSLPQNVDFVKYGKWRRGEGTERTIVRPNLNGEETVGIQAFGYPATEDSGKILVTLTGRSKTWLDSASIKTKVGHTDSLTGYASNGSFVPAKAHCSTLGAGTSQTSAITGRKYKKRGTGSYTIPFGQYTGKTHYQEVVADLITTFVPASNSTNTTAISFSPEQWRRD